MDELEFEDVEYVPRPVRSIVSIGCELEANEIPPVVTYRGVTGLLLRRRCLEHELLALTMTEWLECLQLNTPLP